MHISLYKQCMFSKQYCMLFEYKKYDVSKPYIKNVQKFCLSKNCVFTVVGIEKLNQSMKGFRSDGAS